MAKTKDAAITKWDEQLAARAKVQAKSVASLLGGQFLSIKSGGNMYLGGKQVPGNHIAAVVAAHVFEHAYYTQAFDADNPATPACFAFGTDEATMAPHESSSSPQSAKCATCPRNKFPSKDDIKRQEELVRKRQLDKVRKGKECKNLMRLALLPCGTLDAQGRLTPNEDPADYETASPIYLRVAVTSVKNFATYLAQLDGVLKPPRSVDTVWTRIIAKPHPKNQSETIFERTEEVPGPEIGEVLIRRADELAGTIGFPYQGSSEEAPAEDGNGKRKPRKF